MASEPLKVSPDVETDLLASVVDWCEMEYPGQSVSGNSNASGNGSEKPPYHRRSNRKRKGKASRMAERKERIELLKTGIKTMRELIIMLEKKANDMRKERAQIFEFGKYSEYTASLGQVAERLRELVAKRGSWLLQLQHESNVLGQQQKACKERKERKRRKKMAEREAALCSRQSAYLAGPAWKMEPFSLPSTMPTIKTEMPGTPMLMFGSTTPTPTSWNPFFGSMMPSAQVEGSMFSTPQIETKASVFPLAANPQFTVENGLFGMATPTVKAEPPTLKDGPYIKSELID